jgi:uncharacterized membrane protein YphA (DoxX/SURF4 family)
MREQSYTTLVHTIEENISMNTTISKVMGTASRENAGATSGSAAQSPSLTTTWTILRLVFGLVPIVAGLDKFTNLLVNWENYLNPAVLNLIPLSGHAFMQVVGVIEIAAGVLVLARPRLGGLVVSAWLICIALSLIASGKYLDVAVRDLVMAVGAFTLASLTTTIERTKVAELRQ